MSSDAVETPTAPEGDVPPDHDRTSRESDGSLFTPEIRDFPWVSAAVGGVVAFLAQYLVIAFLFVVGPLSTPQAESLFERLTSYAFVLFGAHNVPVVRTAREVTYQGPRRINIVTEVQEPIIPVVVYLALPVLALSIIGAAVYWRHRGGHGTFYERALLTGMGTAVGYLAVGLVFSVVFVSVTTFDPGSVTQAVDRLTAVVSLLAYPLVFATVGAFAVVSYRHYVA